MKNGRSGTSATEIVLVITVRNSRKPRLSTSELAKIMPRPMMKENTSAAITSSIAGILIETYGLNTSAASRTASAAFAETSGGNAATATK